jgi:uncharacterized protein (DUF2147 family)
MSRKIQIAIVSLFLMFVQTLAMAGGASPVGLWKTIDDVTGNAKSIIRISESGGVLSGTIVKTFPRPGHGLNGLCDDCVGPYHNKNLVGTTVMRGLTADPKEPGTWGGGKITDPLNGKTYRCVVRMVGGSKLDVRGYMGIQMFGRTQTWHRVSSAK